ncbi:MULTISPECIES: hypothetical protein [Methylobacterium]|jgi:hypothetical protein|uniref:DUF2946 domain-containing protein n=3 Tax=Methylobacterium TaxID=407 RepID=A0AA37HD00_9HYPH|nr:MULTISPECIES: hypothetical protein [Methylobacterium]PIK72798.1 hypothetical protein CS379_11990 [Methylobacterium frigidaeris]TGD97908.1 hypothetical protein EU555_17205 [Methylobacterium nonmethylotrophicum]GJD63418.1 hypothetical protein MPEAHAMD_3586 [Methylobacterium frigidaeris]
MGSGHGHSRRRAARAWWAAAARLLALVLALSLVAPVTGYADDIAFHQGHRSVTEVSMADAAPGADATDPGLACHLHCGCHQVAPAVAGSPVVPCLEAMSPVYARVSETASSIAPDRLPEPPRT